MRPRPREVARLLRVYPAEEDADRHEHEALDAQAHEQQREAGQQRVA